MDRRMRLTRTKLDKHWPYRLMILTEDWTFRQLGPLHEKAREIEPTYKTKHAHYRGDGYQVFCFSTEAALIEAQRLLGGRIVQPADFAKSGEWNGRGANVLPLRSRKPHDRTRPKPRKGTGHLS